MVKTPVFCTSSLCYQSIFPLLPIHLPFATFLSSKLEVEAKGIENINNTYYTVLAWRAAGWTDRQMIWKGPLCFNILALKSFSHTIVCMCVCPHMRIIFSWFWGEMAINFFHPTYKFPNPTGMTQRSASKIIMRYQQLRPDMFCLQKY